MSLPMCAVLSMRLRFLSLSESVLSAISVEEASINRKPPFPDSVSHEHPSILQSVNERDVSAVKKSEIAPPRTEDDVHFVKVVFVN